MSLQQIVFRLLSKAKAKQPARDLSILILIRSGENGKSKSAGETAVIEISCYFKQVWRCLAEKA